MSAEDDEGRQRTVAELLQQYGTASAGSSRHRRRAEDREVAEPDLAPQPDPAESDPAESGYPATGGYGPDAYGQADPGADNGRGAGNGYDGQPDRGFNAPGGYNGQAGGHGAPGGYSAEGGYGAPGGYSAEAGYSAPGGYDAHAHGNYDVQDGYSAQSGDNGQGGYNGQPDQPPAGYTADPLFPGTAPPPPPGPGSAPDARWPTGAGYGRSIDPLTGEPVDTVTGRPLSPPDPSAGPYPSDPSAGPYPSDSGGPATAAFPAPVRNDLPTEQLPRYPESAAPGPLTGPITGPMTGPLTGPMTGPVPRLAADAGPATGQVPVSQLFDERGDEDDPEMSPGAPDRPAAARRPAASRLARDAPAGLDDAADLDRDDDGRPQGAKGWVALVAQWVAGAVAGALLWVGFSYLWRNYPVIALVAAVIATAGLVLLVRAIRRSEDLQTTMLAVLVGLVVTISPAVLLLAVR